MKVVSKPVAPRPAPQKPRISQSQVMIGVVALLLLVTGGIVYKAWSLSQVPPPIVEEEVVEELPQVDENIVVLVEKSKLKDSTVVLTVSGMGDTMSMVGYELTFESAGIIQGITSGNKPVDVGRKDTFEREIYLGTCSKNVCKAYPGVKQVSLVLEFTDASGKKSQFSKDYDL